MHFLLLFRQKREKVNFGEVITEDHLLTHSQRNLSIRLKKYVVEDLTQDDSEMSEDEVTVVEPSKYDSKYSVLFVFSFISR